MSFIELSYIQNILDGYIEARDNNRKRREENPLGVLDRKFFNPLSNWVTDKAALPLIHYIGPRLGLGDWAQKKASPHQKRAIELVKQLAIREPTKRWGIGYIDSCIVSIARHLDVVIATNEAKEFFLGHLKITATAVHSRLMAITQAVSKVARFILLSLQYVSQNLLRPLLTPLINLVNRIQDFFELKIEEYTIRPLKEADAEEVKQMEKFTKAVGYNLLTTGVKLGLLYVAGKLVYNAAYAITPSDKTALLAWTFFGASWINFGFSSYYWYRCIRPTVERIHNFAATPYNPNYSPNVYQLYELKTYWDNKGKDLK